MPEILINRPIEDELVDSYLLYSMSVIVGRAIPDVRDGLKPVQRRILYGMYELGLTHNSPTKKSARIVGEVMGKYHPHGDAPVYDALVRMAQPFTMRYPLIEGQGNFGSIDRDPPAAMRYTEARLTRLAEEMLEDIDKNTVNMVDNFDGTLKEPEVLPSKVPNLIINGASGIAVGMATSIPPHNLSETVDALVYLIDHPEASVEELMQFIKGPDFPTGGIVVNGSELKNVYEEGRGRIVVRGKVHVEEGKRLKRIVITEIPYGVSKAGLIEQIAKLVKDDDSLPVRNIRDESDKRGLRVVIEIPKDTNEDIIINNLYKRTALQDYFNVQMLVIDKNKRPRLMNLKGLLEAFLEHRFEVIRRRAEYEYEKFTKRAHVVEGLLKAARAIGVVVDIVRNSKDVESARNSLMETLEISEEQAKAILDMRLSRLTSLEIENLQNEYSDLVKKISEVKEILEKDEKVREIMKKEFLYLKERYGDPRRTEITDEELRYDVEELIVEEDVVITLSHKGYLKSTPLNSYRSQRRGGKGITVSKLSEDDEVEFVVVTKNTSSTLFITNFGKAYVLKNYQIETTGRNTRGKHISAFLNLEDTERIVALVPLNGKGKDLVIVTKSGKIKRTSLEEFENATSNRGVRAIRIEPGDEIVSARVSTSEKETLVVATKLGMIIRFPVSDVRRMGRNAAGVQAIKLQPGDEVVSMDVVPSEEGEILTVTEKGFGKRTPVQLYRVQKRGGTGLRNISDVNKTGHVVAVRYVKGDEEIVVVTRNGMMIRMPVSEIGVIGRVTKGVKLIELGDDTISKVAVVKD
ncbi:MULTISPECIES: DNA gyrase subunit A [Thermotoga]|uniref:DNA gyrase subunit A n=2 Tax=Thermotoga neapolitana TaxID=2337 RepID=B9K9M8_THENN|nr:MULTISPECIES: DNA gyrase subunit A [Thermotoga]ACM23661.1 DNA gyrase subunit A [Thermotoga neapolitana DSM 4359]AJG41558.1 DNA gyrase subunit A [Thermotoga sp. RQ7]KFZ21282.1 DNA gyrase subunit A [Thermotoga neapolitana LA10]HBF10306.1 DNA gyrase subunit A [Thermotoga neapolitana]